MLCKCKQVLLFLLPKLHALSVNGYMEKYGGNEALIMDI